MFFEGERITAMREMIVARDEGGRRRALAKLLPMQRADFEGIFEAMAGCPVTIRLLDPPLHEFLPHGGEESKLLARTLGVSREELARVVDDLRETNPMLGHRGCRLGVTYPEITEMQSRAIFEAAVRVARRGVVGQARGDDPARGDRARVRAPGGDRPPVAGDVLGAMGVDGRLHGRHHDRAAASRAHGRRDRPPRRVLLVRHQRPDADRARPVARRRGRFLPTYVEKGIFPRTRSRSRRAGVGKIIRRAIFDGRSTRRRSRSGSVANTAASRVGALLPPQRARLRVVLAVPGTRGATRAGPRGARVSRRRRAARAISARKLSS
jgi:pyruvate,orthophosphate dikinase